MNYQGLSEDIAELFDDAQHLTATLPWYLVRRTPPQGSGSIAPLVSYERAACARCGAPVEIRPGVKHPVHLGRAQTCADRVLRSIGR